jgi:hypothetical protein
MADLDVRALPHDDVSRVECPRCGTFEIAGDAWAAFENHLSANLGRNRYLLSGRARVATLNGEVVRFEMKDFVAAERGEIAEPILEEKTLLMLKWFQRRSRRFGQSLKAVASTDYPVAYCKDEDEWTALIEDLVGEKLLNYDAKEHFSITRSGINRLAQRAVVATSGRESDVTIVPAHFGQYQPDVDRFFRDAPFEDSVFVMMKFPDATKMQLAAVKMLDDIFKTIRDELSRYGLNARRADEKTYASSRQLWDNLCVYMLGCKYGLAVLEDRSGEDFNPNVALEYGFMKALGRDAVLVKERGFKYIRADVLATIPKEFSIGPDFDLDESSLRDAVEEWMIDLGRHARRRR